MRRREPEGPRLRLMLRMTTRALFFALAVLVLALPRPRAEPAFGCADASKGVLQVICADRELVALDKAVDARFNALVARADPLTALLLRRDQSWFTEILGDADTAKFTGENDPERLRLKEVLTQRLATLNAIKPRAVGATPAGASLAGTWANALATIAVSEAGGGDTLQVTLEAKLAYEGHDTFTCNLAGTVKADGTGWLTGELAVPDGEQARARLRLRLQGNTLRAVHLEDDDEPRICHPLAMITGSYFPMNAAAAVAAPAVAALAVAARTVSPSFKCASAQNSDEVEICADPELAARDAEIARRYGETLRRLEPRLVAQLRADQRGWAKDNPTAYDSALHSPGPSNNFELHDTDGARGELMRRLDERLAMLVNLDEKREGLLGLWEAYNAVLTIVPAKGKTDGTLVADGFKWQTGDRKEFCTFKSAGRMQGDVFKTAEEFPTLTRDGATLITSAEAPDHDRMAPGGPAAYCNNMRSAKARLFPVKPSAGMEAKFDRIR